METEEYKYEIMSRMYGDHLIVMLVQIDRNGQAEVISSCRFCQRHKHFGVVDFGDEEGTFMLNADFQLHATGVNDGWTDGYGFNIDDH